MRALVGVFSLAVLGSTAFAVNELRALRRHAAAALVAETPPQPVEEAAAPAVAPSRPALSTWHGALPFGGVPVAPPATTQSDDRQTGEVESDESENDSGDDIPDEIDRCPDDGDGDGVDNDGCPDVNRTGVLKVTTQPPHTVVVTIDGVQQRVIHIGESRLITLERNTIIY